MRYLIKLHTLQFQTQNLLHVLKLQTFSNKWWSKMNSGCSGIFLCKKNGCWVWGKYHTKKTWSLSPLCLCTRYTVTLQWTKIKCYALSLVSHVFQLIPISKWKGNGSKSFIDQTDCSQEDENERYNLLHCPICQN